MNASKNPDAEPLDVALIGVGRWGANILRDLVNLGARVHAVARSRETLQKAQAAGASNTYHDIGDLPALHGAVVAVRSDLHAEAIEGLLERQPDLRVFCEKPVVPDVARLERIADRWPDQVFEMHKWRYHGAILGLAKIAHSGTLGDAIGLASVRVAWGYPADNVDFLWHLLPHDLSIALEILDHVPQVRHVTADASGTAAGHVFADLGDTPWHHIEVGCRTLEKRRWVRLQCEDGAALMRDPYADHIELVRNRDLDAKGPEIQRVPVDTRMPLEAELDQFLQHLAGGPPPHSSADEALQVAKRIQEIRRGAGLA